MSNWAIISTLGNMGVLTKEGTFSANVFEARMFESREEALAIAVTIKTATLVQQLELPAVPTPKFKVPHPDFFEASPNYMELEELFDAINDDFPTSLFEPVDRITGGGQMTGRGIEDPLSGKLIGREYQFSFPRVLYDNDINTLHETFRQSPEWTSVMYQIKRLGFTAYAVLTLRVKNK